MESQSIHSTVFQIKNQDQENFKCIDCQNPITCYISLSHGCFICAFCADQHLSLGDSVSKVVSEEDHLSENDLNYIHSGGNTAFSEFLRYYNLVSIPISSKYHTKAVKFYREMLKNLSLNKEVNENMPEKSEGGTIDLEFLTTSESQINQPLLHEPSIQNNWLRNLFSCFIETSSDIGNKVQNKLKEISETPTAINAEIKTKEFLNAFGEKVNQLAEHEKIRKLRDKAGEVVLEIKNRVLSEFGSNEAMQ